MNARKGNMPVGGRIRVYVCVFVYVKEIAIYMHSKKKTKNDNLFFNKRACVE